MWIVLQIIQSVYIDYITRYIIWWYRLQIIIIIIII